MGLVDPENVAGPNWERRYDRWVEQQQREQKVRDLQRKIDDVARKMVARSELGANDPYSLSHAEKGNSAFSVGVSQTDFGQNPERAKEVARLVADTKFQKDLSKVEQLNNDAQYDNAIETERLAQRTARAVNDFAGKIEEGLKARANEKEKRAFIEAHKDEINNALHTTQGRALVDFYDEKNIEAIKDSLWD